MLDNKIDGLLICTELNELAKRNSNRLGGDIQIILKEHYELEVMKN